MTERRHSEEGGAIHELATKAQSGGRETSQSVLGLTIGVGNSVDLGRNFTDAEWEQLVVTLRETFDARGKVKIEGASRQWVNSRLQVLVEPSERGDRVRFKTYNGTSAGLMAIGLGMLGVTGAMVIARAVDGRLSQPRALTVVVFLGAVNLAVFAWGALRLPRWAQRRRKQFRELADRLATPNG